MAARCCMSAPLCIQTPSSKKRPPIMLPRANNHVAAINTTSLEMIRSSSSSRMKVFEDRSKGIVCYRDDKGEITCEGYDEGPRIHNHIPRFTCNPRDAELVDLLQSLFQTVDGGEF